jgi:hypothetical protein
VCESCHALATNWQNMNIINFVLREDTKPHVTEYCSPLQCTDHNPVNYIFVFNKQLTWNDSAAPADKNAICAVIAIKQSTGRSECVGNHWSAHNILSWKTVAEKLRYKHSKKALRRSM